MKDEKTGLELIGETEGISKYIDHDNKTVIYTKGTYSSGYCMCCTPLYEDEIKREQIPSSSTDGIFINKPKFGTCERK